MLFNKLLIFIGILVLGLNAGAQTDNDAIMMSRNSFCTGLMYQYGSWKEYWEGTYKREALNLGTVSTRSTGIMGNYGLRSNLNLLFSLPYVQTKATAGTLHGMKGLQDLSLWIKYMPLEITRGNHTFSLYTIGGLSFPASDYVADFLPLSIGLHSTNLSLRAMGDYQYKDMFVTASATYIFRSNITIDRTSYYTTEMHTSNEVEMPDAAQYTVRAGYRSDFLIAEMILDRWNTIGGFDIRKNDMPFPSNNMDMTRLGFNAKYTLKRPAGLSLIAGADVTVEGRNVGKTTAAHGGIFYIFNFHTSNKTK